MSTANLDSADLKAASGGSMLNEDVMQKIWDVSAIPLPFTDKAGTASMKQEYTEWAQDKLNPPNLNNKRIDGSDTTGNDTVIPKRLGNHGQESTKTVRVSTRANASDNIGQENTLAYQLTRRLQELKRDVEAISVSSQGSVADDGNTTAGEAGSVFSFISTNVDLGATGTAAGFNPTTKVTADVMPGTARGATEKMIRDMQQKVYLAGGDPTIFMSIPGIVRGFSEYLFTSGAKVGTMVSDIGQDKGGQTVAKGAVTVFEGDFGILTLVPNRLQQETSAGVGSIGLFDFNYIDLAYLWGPRTEELAKTGLADNRQIGVDWTVKVRNEEAQGAIHAITAATAWIPGT